MAIYLNLSSLGNAAVKDVNLDPTAVEILRTGFRVDRAAADLPTGTGSGASRTLFTVTGYCKIFQILGRVTTVIQTQACNYSLEANPTVAGANVALCGVLNISAKAVGTLFGLTGTLADAMLSGLAIIGQATPLIVPPGTIEDKTSADNTGQVTWSLWYAPLSAGAVIVAA